MTAQRKEELTNQVIEIQNLAKNQGRDIVTFTAFFDTEGEFLNHIARYK